MKIVTSVLLFFFIFSTASCFPDEDGPVLDVDGEPLLPGAEYHIVSAIRGSGGGGVGLPSSADLSCPKFVIQKQDELDYGRPVTFWPLDTNASFISLSTDLRVVFVPGLDDAHCRSTATQWEIDDFDPSMGQWGIRTGLVRGEPGPQTLKSWFKIWSGDFDRVYRLKFCPSFCDSCITFCNNIGRYSHDGNLRLILEPIFGWQFFFMKASKAKV